MWNLGTDLFFLKSSAVDSNLFEFIIKMPLTDWQSCVFLKDKLEVFMVCSLGICFKLFQ